MNVIIMQKFVDRCNSLPSSKKLTFHNVIILIKSVWNEDKNRYYHNIFSEKGLYVPANSNNKQVCASVINTTL